jgi:hypothetical protein
MPSNESRCPQIHRRIFLIFSGTGLSQFYSFQTSDKRIILRNTPGFRAVIKFSCYLNFLDDQRDCILIESLLVPLLRVLQTS